MARLNQNDLNAFFEEERAEVVAHDKKRKNGNTQSGLISTKISKITRDLIPSEEDKALAKTDLKRLKKGFV